MKTAYITISIIAALLFILGYYKDPMLPLKGMKGGFNFFLKIVPLILLAFFVAEMIHLIIPNELFMRWMGTGTGLKGIFIGSLAGMLTPGGPFISFPIAASIYKSGAGIGPMVAYITAWCLLSVTRLPYEIAFVGLKFTLIRAGSSLIFPVIIGAFAQNLFSK